MSEGNGTARNVSRIVDAQSRSMLTRPWHGMDKRRLGVVWTLDQNPSLARWVLLTSHGLTWDPLPKGSERMLAVDWDGMAADR
jgi:hypothetical protein